MKRILSLVMALLLFLSPVASADTLKVGSEGEQVQRLQQRLIDLGLLSGTADGVYGNNTKVAVSDFQSCLQAAGYSLSVDGVAGDQTQEYLFDADLDQDLFTLKLGDSGSAVTRLQNRLIDLGFLDGTADGQFGEMTQTALIDFQEYMRAQGAEGAQATGVLDAWTRSVIYGDLSDYGIASPSDYDASSPGSLKPGHLYAQSAILIDADTGEVLLEKNADKQMYPASTTKILTLVLALESLTLDARVTIPAEAKQIPGDSSVVPLNVGETMTVEDLLHGLMIRSGNDAAMTVALTISGSTERFAERMNEKAQSLGMTNSHFVNPHGYHDPDHYTTARDLATLTRYALKSEEFREIVTVRKYTMAATSKRQAMTISNLYAILDPSSRYYCEGAFGVKTGYTSKAGQCYVGACERDGRTLIAVVLNSRYNRENKWLDTQRMFEFGFAN